MRLGKHEDHVIKNPLLSAELQRLVRENGISTNAELGDKVSEALGDISSSEHARKVVAGLSNPSPFYLKALSEVLGADYKELKRLHNEDQLQYKFGSVLREGHSAPIPSDLVPFQKAWPLLEQGDKNTLLKMLKMFVAGKISDLEREATV